MDRTYGNQSGTGKKRLTESERIQEALNKASREARRRALLSKAPFIAKGYTK